MAQKGFSLDFDGFMDLAREVDELGEDALHTAVDNAFTKSKDYVNSEIEKAMDASKYNFTKGEGYSQGKAKESLHNVEAMPVEWNGSVAVAKIGVSYTDARELHFIIYGSPNTPKDTKIYNAAKVKGKVKKEVERIQQEEFLKAIKEAMDD